MSNLLYGTVVKGLGGVFDVMCNKDVYVCVAPKKLRYGDSDVLVGDKVSFTLEGKKGVISKVLPRKNRMARPEVANIDIAFILVTVSPAPDLSLVDKILVNCFHNNITPVVVVSKSDIADDDFLKRIHDNYDKVCDVVSISAHNNDVSALLHYIDGNTVCFAGQSAVGKTSLLNALVPNLNKAVGGLSHKTGRGRHTTRSSIVYSVGNGFVVDTTGFSMLEVTDTVSTSLMLYYDDFMQLSGGCRFKMCTHISEPDCAVKKAVEEGNICKERYDRYVTLFGELAEKEKNKYK